MAGRRRKPCELCQDEIIDSQYVGRSQLCVEIYPEIGNIYVGAYFDDEAGESQELSYNIPMNFCPNCGRRLGL